MQSSLEKPRYSVILQQVEERVSMDIEDDDSGDFHMPDVDPFASALPVLEELIVASFTPSFQALFVKQYGQSWAELVLPQPWSIHDIVRLLKNEWTTVFHDCPSELRTKLERLIRISKDIARVNDMGLTSITLGDLSIFMDEIKLFFFIFEKAGFPNDAAIAEHHLEDLKRGLPT
jgi:hypothetical protein